MDRLSSAQGTVVVVTGAASGIGRATALRLARAGATVHACDVAEEGLRSLQAEVGGAGGALRAHVVDVTDAAAVDALAETVFAEHGAVDMLHNNAGIGIAGPVDALQLADWRRTIEVNLMGVVHGVTAFVPRMLAQGRPGHVVNTSSSAGLMGFPFLVPYSTSKFGVLGMSLAMDAELRSRGVRVSAVCPGVIDTPIVEHTEQRGNVGDRDRTIRMFRRFGASPDVVAEAVVRAWLRQIPVVVVPRRHVAPGWLMMRLSPRLFGRLMAFAARRVA